MSRTDRANPSRYLSPYRCLVIFVFGPCYVAVLITDQEYPIRPAFSLLTKVLEDFTHKVLATDYKNASRVEAAFKTDIDGYIQKYQDPRQADTLMRVQQELDETKIVLHQTIESMLKRGEKLDNLVDRSNALSAQSKMFYKTAKKVSLDLHLNLRLCKYLDIDVQLYFHVAKLMLCGYVIYGELLLHLVELVGDMMRATCFLIHLHILYYYNLADIQTLDFLVLPSLYRKRTVFISFDQRIIKVNIEEFEV